MSEPDPIFNESMKALRARRVRRLAQLASASAASSSSQASQTTGLPAGYAAAPASSKTPWPVRSRVRETEHFLELTFDDESREWTLRFKANCAVCNGPGALERLWRPLLGRFDYRMHCHNQRCANVTDWFSNSQDAIQVWRLAAALAKP